MKRTIRLTESELKQVIKESATAILNEAGFGNAMNRAFQGKKISGYVKNVQDVITAFNNAIKQNPQAANNSAIAYTIKILNNELASIQNGDLKVYNSPSMNHNIAVLNKKLGTNIQLPENGGIQQAGPQMQQQAEDYHNLSEYQDALNASYYCGYWYASNHDGNGKEALERAGECSDRRDESLRVLAQKYGVQSPQYQAIKQECQNKYYEGEKYYENEKIGMRRQQAQQYQQQQQQMNARRQTDNYYNAEGYQDYGNGNAYGA